MPQSDEERYFPRERYPSPRLTEDMLAEIVEELKPRPPLRPTLLRPTLVQEIKNQKYKNFIVDLSVLHDRTPIVEACGGSGGLRALGIVGDTMSIIRRDAAFDYILNAPTNDPTPAVAGMDETEFEIEEIYITNVAGVAGDIAIIRVNYNPFLIRIR